jgi:anti-sigma-K factor RskA
VLYVIDEYGEKYRRRNFMNCEEIEELSGAYVLGAVTDDERKAIEDHLERCPQAMHLIEELQAVVNVLPLSVSQTAPSSHVKSRIMAAIQADPTRKQINLAPLPAASVPLPAASHPLQNLRYQVMAAASVLLLALVLAMGAWNISLQQHVAQVADSNIALQHQVAQLATSVRANTPIAYTVKGSQVVPDATGQVTYIPDLDMTVLVMHNLPPTKGAQVYQGWLLQGKQPLSIGLLNQHDGTATLNFQGNIKGFDAAAVSLEPGPLASKNAPQGKIVASGVLT